MDTKLRCRSTKLANVAQQMQIRVLYPLSMPDLQHKALHILSYVNFAGMI